MKRKFVNFSKNGSWHLVLDEPNLTEKEGLAIANSFQNAVLLNNPIALSIGKSFFNDESFGKPLKTSLIDYNDNVNRIGAIQINQKGGYCNLMIDDIVETKFDTIKNVFH